MGWEGPGMRLGANFFLGLGPNNRNNGNNGVWLAVVVLVVSNRLLFKPGSPCRPPAAGLPPHHSTAISAQFCHTCTDDAR